MPNYEVVLVRSNCEGERTRLFMTLSETVKADSSSSAGPNAPENNVRSAVFDHEPGLND